MPQHSNLTAPPLGSTTIVQVGIVVHDIATTAAAWAEVLGLPVPEVIITAPVEQAQTECRGQSTPARAKLAFFHLGQVALELIEPIGGPSTWAEHLAAHGQSIHHIAFVIQGMAAQIANLGGRGIPLLQRGEYTGGRYAYLDGMERLGAVLELLEND